MQTDLFFRIEEKPRNWDRESLDYINLLDDIREDYILKEWDLKEESSTKLIELKQEELRIMRWAAIHRFSHNHTKPFNLLEMLWFNKCFSR